VLRGKATFSEIMEKWDICDLADANEALDLQDAADAWYAARAKERAEAQRGY